MGSVNAKGSLVYRCASCQKVHVRSCTDLVWELVESREKPLGNENHFLTAWKETCDCGGEASFEFKVREYPFNCLDGEDLRVSGAELLRVCNIGVKESVFLPSTKAG